MNNDRVKAAKGFGSSSNVASYASIVCCNDGAFSSSPAWVDKVRNDDSSGFDRSVRFPLRESTVMLYLQLVV